MTSLCMEIGLMLKCITSDNLFPSTPNLLWKSVKMKKIELKCFNWCSSNTTYKMWLYSTNKTVDGPWVTVIGPYWEMVSFQFVHATHFPRLHSESLNTRVNVTLSAFWELSESPNHNLPLTKIEFGSWENELMYGMQILWRECLHQDGPTVLMSQCHHGQTSMTVLVVSAFSEIPGSYAMSITLFVVVRVAPCGVLDPQKHDIT